MNRGSLAHARAAVSARSPAGRAETGWWGLLAGEPDGQRLDPHRAGHQALAGQALLRQVEDVAEAVAFERVGSAQVVHAALDADLALHAGADAVAQRVDGRLAGVRRLEQRLALVDGDGPGPVGLEELDGMAAGL